MSLTKCASQKRSLVPLMQHGEMVCRHYEDQQVAAISCSECAYVGFLPPPDTELSQYYSEHYGKNAASWYSLEADYHEGKVNERAGHVAGIATQYFANPEAVVTMEVGCAFGGTVAELRRRGYTAYGADLNTDAIHQGRAHGNEFIFAEMAQSVLLERGERANIIYAYHALEHIPDVHGFLHDMKNCLAERAVMEFMVPNGAYLKAWKQGFDSWDWFTYPDHLHMFSPRSALCLARSTGLELLEVRSRRCGEPLDWIRNWSGWSTQEMPDSLLESMLEQALLMDELTLTFCVAGSEIATEYAHVIEKTTRRCLQSSDAEKALRSLS